VFVKLHGTGYAEVEIPAEASVAALADAVIAKLKLEAAPHQLTLKLEGAAEPLDATLTLEEARVNPRAKLIVEMRSATGACVESMT
jgi:hypothetical protein